MLLEGLIRRFPALRVLTESSTALRQTGQLSLAVAQVEGEGCEESRAGRRFWMSATNGVTGQAAVASLSATPVFPWVIWNTSPTKSLVFDTVGVFNNSGAPVAGGNVLGGAIFTAPAQSGAQATGIQVSSMSGGGLTTVAVVKSAVTPTAPSAIPNIVPIAANNGAGTTAFQQAIVNDQLRGRLIVPPTSGLGLIVYGSSASTLFVPFAWWVEKELDLE